MLYNTDKSADCIKMDLSVRVGKKAGIIQQGNILLINHNPVKVLFLYAIQKGGLAIGKDNKKGQR